MALDQAMQLVEQLRHLLNLIDDSPAAREHYRKRSVKRVRVLAQE